MYVYIVRYEDGTPFDIYKSDRSATSAAIDHLDDNGGLDVHSTDICPYEDMGNEAILSEMNDRVGEGKRVFVEQREVLE